MPDTVFKARFAPSPTGLLHLGNVRTALFNFLAARHHRGTFLLRIEDTDLARGHEKYARALEEDLAWLGLRWDEGPGADAGHGPYAQSRRGEIYARYFAALAERRLAYPCFCSERELEVARKTALAAGRPPRYSGRCYRLSPEEVERRIAAGTPATLRFHVPDGQTVEFEDRVRGRQSFSTTDIGDFVIRRSDGTPAFFFSNAIDDALMGVTLVLRGEDHLTNTPRQILLLQALGLSVPQYAHIALVVGPDGAPLSKRHGSLSVQELRQRGYLPAAINNYLARLGHTYEDNSLMDLPGLALNFSVERLHRAPARFDMHQLLHWQKEAVAAASEDALWAWMADRTYVDGGDIRSFVPEEKRLEFVRAIRDNIVQPVEAFLWAGNLFSERGVYGTEAREAIRAAGPDFFRGAVEALDAGISDFKALTASLASATGKKGKSLFMPLRAALTGEHDPDLQRELQHSIDWHAGPELARVWPLLGPGRVRRRLELAIAESESESETKP